MIEWMAFVPRKFGNYLLTAPLGQGGMGEVFQAESIGTQGVNKRFAIKILRREFTYDPKMIALFKAEAGLAIQLSHNNVVSIHEFGLYNQQFFMVMDLVDGQSLREHLKALRNVGQCMRLEEALQVARDAAIGLDYVHRAKDEKSQQPMNIIHGDISPHNILLSREGEVKIIDFGVARTPALNKILGEKALVGKIKYMAPEVFEGGAPSMQADIFSLGAVLWEMIFGFSLYDCIPKNMVPKGQDSYRTPQFPDEPPIPPRVAQVLEKALAPWLNDRYTTAGEMANDLGIALNLHFPGYSSRDLRSQVQPQSPRHRVDRSVRITGVEERGEWTPRPPDRADLGEIPSFFVSLAVKWGSVLLVGILLVREIPYWLDKAQKIKPEELLYAQPIVRRQEAIGKQLDGFKTDSTRQTTSLGDKILKYAGVKRDPSEEKPQVTYAIKVVSDPPGAQIVMNRSPIGAITPIVVRLHSPAPVHFSLQLEGYRSCEATVDPAAGLFNCNLKKKRK